MPTTPSTINYYIAADGTLRDGQAGSIAQTPRINYGTNYAVTLSFPPSTIAEDDQLQVAVNRSRTFFSSASATGDAPVAAVAKHEVTAAEADAQAVTLTLSTNTRAMIDQVNGIDHPVRGFFGVHVLRGQSFISLAVADAFMMSVESGPDAISPSLPVVDYPTREEAIAIKDEALVAAGKAKKEADRAEQAAAGIVPPLQLDAPPTTSTVGSVGQLATWHDSETNTDHLYHLVFISTSETATLYHWEECVITSMGNVAGGYPVLDANGKVASAQLPDMDNTLMLDSAPTTSTVGKLSQHAFVTTTGKEYYCKAIDDTDPNAQVYTWEEVIVESQRNVDNGFAGLNANAKIHSAQIPQATDIVLGGVKSWPVNGIGIHSTGQLYVNAATTSMINSRNNAYGPITTTILDYAVRSVLPNVTEIPVATSDYSLVDSSATTNNHSMTYRHSPQTPSVYHLPAVAANSTVLHEIVLTIKFSSTVLTYEFQDSAGTTLVPLPLNGDIEAGSVVTFLCRYNSLLSQWVIYPVMDGKEAQE